MRPARRSLTLPNGVTVRILARLGTVNYRFFDGDREYEGAVYFIEPLRGFEHAPVDGVIVAVPANDACG